MAKTIKTIRESLKKRLETRNKKIIKNALTLEYSLADLSKKHGVSRERIRQILREAGIKVPLTRGTKRWDRWHKKVIEGNKKRARQKKFNPKKNDPLLR